MASSAYHKLHNTGLSGPVWIVKGTSMLVTATIADGHRQRGQGVQCWLPGLPVLIQKMPEPGRR